MDINYKRIETLNKTYMQIVLNLIIGSTILSRINSIYYFAIVEILFVLIPCLILFKQTYSDFNLNTLGFKNVNSNVLKLSFYVPVLSYPLIILVNTIFIMILPELKMNITGINFHVFSFDFWTQIIVFALIPAISEELLFRGYLLKEYSKINRFYGIMFVSFLFALTHLNPYNFISSFLLSILLSQLTLVCDSIVPAIIGHFLNNTIVIIFSNFQVKLLEIRNGVLTLSNNTDYSFFWTLSMLVLLSSFLLVKIFNELNKEKISKNESEEYQKDFSSFILEHNFKFEVYKYVYLIIFFFLITYLSLYF